MPPQPFPEPRIDTLVTDAVSGEQRRRTDYRGIVWYGQPLGVSYGVVVLCAPAAVAG